LESADRTASGLLFHQEGAVFWRDVGTLVAFALNHLRSSIVRPLVHSLALDTSSVVGAAQSLVSVPA
jgi:hypothetical protein